MQNSIQIYLIATVLFLNICGRCYGRVRFVTWRQRARWVNFWQKRNREHQYSCISNEQGSPFVFNSLIIPKGEARAHTHQLLRFNVVHFLAIKQEEKVPEWMESIKLSGRFYKAWQSRRYQVIFSRVTPLGTHTKKRGPKLMEGGVSEYNMERYKWQKQWRKQKFSLRKNKGEVYSDTI